jgi:hypothetical protein
VRSIAVAGLLTAGAIFVAPSPASASVKPYGDCTTYKFINHIGYYLQETHRGVPPKENNRYLYGTYWTGYDAPQGLKFLCGPI